MPCLREDDEVVRRRRRDAAPLQRRQIMYARSTTIQGLGSSIDVGIAHTRDSVMPALEGIDGCGGVSPLVEPDVRARPCYQLLGVRGGDARKRGDHSADS